MAKIVVFADLHAHPFTPYASILDNGMNSRLNDAVECLKGVLDAAVANKASLILFAGDMFHTRGRLSVIAFNAIHDVLEEFKFTHSGRIRVVMIAGNHDQADRIGEETSISGLRHVAEVIESGCWRRYDTADETIDIVAIPYTENVEAIKDLINRLPPRPYKKILLGHFGIQGAKMGADFVCATPYDPTITDLSLDKFDAAFFGHYHLQQQLAPNAWYVGAPLQHNWGDAQQVRGFMLYDTKTGVAEHVALKSPRFVRVKALPKVGEYTDCYVILETDKPWTAAEITETKVKHKFRSFDIIPMSAPEMKSAGPRLAVSVSMAMHNVLEKYVAAGINQDEGLDQDLLLQLGIDLLGEAAQDAI